MNCRPHRDPVTPELRIEVLERDGGCVAPRLGGSYLDCFGRTTLAHVKDEPRLGVRAPSDARHLASVCEGHAEAGMRAGYVWVTDRRNIEALRAYLASVGEPQR
jgi:hypothetical protein